MASSGVRWNSQDTAENVRMHCALLFVLRLPGTPVTSKHTDFFLVGAAFDCGGDKVKETSLLGPISCIKRQKEKGYSEDCLRGFMGIDCATTNHSPQHVTQEILGQSSIFT